MKLSYIILGLVLILLGGWLMSPLSFPFLFWTVKIQNPFASFGKLLVFAGIVVLIYGFVAKEVKG